MADTKATSRNPQAAKFYRGRRRGERLSLQMPPPPAPVRAMSGVSTRPLAFLDRRQQHPGFGLEPAAVVRIYRTAEWGWPCEQCDLFDDIVENDGHLRSLMVARTLAVSGKSWQVAAGGAEPIDLVAAEELEKSLRAANFDDLIQHILQSRYYGYSGSEIVWEDVEGFVRPTWFVNVPCRRFRFDEQDSPLLINEDNLEGEQLAAGKWIFTRGAGGLAARAGLGRTFTWYALFKKWSWRDFTIYAEKFGIPLVLGKYAAEASEEDRDTLETAVNDIGEAGQAVMSEDTSIEITEAQRGGDSNGLHSKIIDEANREMSKLITGSTLTTDSGPAGSFALGKVHETRSFDLVVSDADLVVRQFAGLARLFLRYNDLQGAAVPTLNIHIAREVDPLTRAKIAQIMQGMGLPLDEDQLRQEFQFRAPPTEERALTAPEAAESPEGDE